MDLTMCRSYAIWPRIFVKVECWGKLAGIGSRRTERKGIRYRQYENFSNIFYMVGMKLMKK